MSWIITRKSTGEVIGEFFDRRSVARFNPATCLIETVGDYLTRFNAKVLAEGRIAAACRQCGHNRIIGRSTCGWCGATGKQRA